MEYKHFSLALLTASILAGCGGGDGDNSSSTDTNDSGSVSTTSCMTISAEKLCVNTEFAAQSGDRLYIPITGNIPENVTLTWAVSDSGELKAPLISNDSKGAYIIAPVSNDKGSVQIDVRADTDDQLETGEITTYLNVTPADNLTLNGINSITVDENSMLNVEWLAATDSTGALASSPTYTLSVTHLIDGEPSNDTDSLTTTQTQESISVLAGETYRLVLSVASDSGVVTYSEHYDYAVPNALPELASYITDSAPDANNYEDGQIIDQDGTFMIVRENEEGEKAIVEAEEYELYSPDAPLVVSLRIKDLTTEELSSYSSAFSTYNSTNTNSFTVSAQESELVSYASVKPSVDAIQACYKTSITGLTASACAPYEKMSLVCEARFELSSRPKTYASCNYSGTVNVTATASTKNVSFDVMWPYPKIEKEYKGTKLVIAPNVGLKTVFSMPIKVTTDFDVNTSVYAKAGIELGAFYVPGFTGSGHATTNVVPKNGKFFNVLLGNDTTNDEINLSFVARLGAFPTVQLGQYVKGNIEGAGRVTIEADYVPLAGGLTDADIPVVSTVDANIDMNAYAKATLKTTFTGAASLLNTDKTFNWESPKYVLYKHPTNVTLSVFETEQCTGRTTYHGEYPVVGVPEYGDLNDGEQYGWGFENVDKYTFSNMGGLSLVGVKSLDSTLLAARSGTTGALMTYNMTQASSSRTAKILFSFQNTSSRLGAFFPTYGLEETKTRFASSMEWPWVCWGNAYEKVSSDGSANLTLTQLAKLSELD